MLRQGMKKNTDHLKNNPLLQLSNLYDQAVPFDQIRTEHFLPALDESISQAYENIDQIKNRSEDPDFKNTILALETSSDLMDYIAGVFLQPPPRRSHQ